MTTSYKTIQDFRVAKLQARQERDRCGERIAGNWSVLQDPATRGVLFRDAAGDVLRSWGPYRKVQDLMQGRISGSTISAIGMTVASMQRGFGKRLLYSGISMLLGKALDAGGQKGPSLLSTVASGIGSVVKGMRERKAERERKEVEEQAVPADVA